MLKLFDSQTRNCQRLRAEGSKLLSTSGKGQSHWPATGLPFLSEASHPRSSWKLQGIQGKSSTQTQQSYLVTNYMANSLTTQSLVWSHGILSRYWLKNLFLFMVRNPVWFSLRFLLSFWKSPPWCLVPCLTSCQWFPTFDCLIGFSLCVPSSVVSPVPT